METERGTTQEFNRFPFVRDLHEIQPVFPEADFGLGITSGLPVTRAQSSRCQEWPHPIGAQEVSTAPFYGIRLVAERLVSKVNSSIKGGF
jgi:hypothetical protein